MHVIRDDRAPVGSQRPTDGPVVAPVQLRLADLVGRRRCPAHLPNRIDVSPGYPGHRARLAHEGCVPGGSLGIEPGIHRFRQHLGRIAAADVAVRLRIVKLHEHHVDDEYRVLGHPGLWLRLQ